MPSITVEPCTFALFGALGDLALRKLFPALYQLDGATLLHDDTRILALAREAGSEQQHLAHIEQELRKYVGKELDETVAQRFLARLTYVHVDFMKADDYVALADIAGTEQRLIAYFATPAAVYGAICENLSKVGLAENTRVVLEKPIGSDLESSRKVNDAVAQFFPENRTYRIDHYLGKETVQNLIALRFANSLFETQWNQNYISHVEITVAEQVGIEGRWGYFDKAGQLRDMIQNHLLQLLCLIAMDPPADLSADSIRDEKVKVLKALAPISPDGLTTQVVRGQYIAGYSAGKPVPGYLEEENSNTQSDTETFVALRADIRNWRWAGVPFYLRTGKRMSSRHSDIVIQFKAAPHNIFGQGVDSVNRLVIRLQPDEAVRLFVQIKEPGPGGLRVKSLPLNLSYAESFTLRYPDAYERLLMDIVRGNLSLFMRREEVEAAWRWVDSLIESWEASGYEPEAYAAGTDGPLAAAMMLDRDGRSWWKEG